MDTITTLSTIHPAFLFLELEPLQSLHKSSSFLIKMMIRTIPTSIPKVFDFQYLVWMYRWNPNSIDYVKIKFTKMDRLIFTNLDRII